MHNLHDYLREIVTENLYFRICSPFFYRDKIELPRKRQPEIKKRFVTRYDFNAGL